MIRIISAGVKWGDLPTCDHSVDMRRFRNPYLIEGLRELTGLDAKVRQAVLSTSGVRERIKKAHAKVVRGNADTILFYCHAGHHRSVVAAEELARLLGITAEHRDLERS